DWSSDVCSSDLGKNGAGPGFPETHSGRLDYLSGENPQRSGRHFQPGGGKPERLASLAPIILQPSGTSRTCNPCRIGGQPLFGCSDVPEQTLIPPALRFETGIRRGAALQ